MIDSRGEVPERLSTGGGNPPGNEFQRQAVDKSAVIYRASRRKALPARCGAAGTISGIKSKVRNIMEEGLAFLKTFQTTAENVSAVVSRVHSMVAAITYTMDLCAGEEVRQRLVPVCKMRLSDPAQKRCDCRQAKVLAAPMIPEKYIHLMGALCAQSGVRLVREDLRDHLAGIDIGFTIADFGIAETGALVIDSCSEDVRLATMISKVLVAVLPASRIRKTSDDLEEDLRNRFGSSPNHHVFITGASRTADIERVLALGIHGPLELHILVLEDD
jgi:L-lactate dehydrogenase complex protein LldG